MTTYIVTTWDPDLQRFTPQRGVPIGPYTQFGLRRALRALQRLGYDTTRSGGHYVEVERVLHRVVYPPQTESLEFYARMSGPGPRPCRDIPAHVLDVVADGILQDLQTT